MLKIIVYCDKDYKRDDWVVPIAFRVIKNSSEHTYSVMGIIIHAGEEPKNLFLFEKRPNAPIRKGLWVDLADYDITFINSGRVILTTL